MSTMVRPEPEKAINTCLRRLLFGQSAGCPVGQLAGGQLAGGQLAGRPVSQSASWPISRSAGRPAKLKISPPKNNPKQY